MIKPNTTPFKPSDLAAFEDAPALAEFTAGVQVHASDQGLLQSIKAATVGEDA